MHKHFNINFFAACCAKTPRDVMPIAASECTKWRCYPFLDGESRFSAERGSVATIHSCAFVRHNFAGGFSSGTLSFCQKARAKAFQVCKTFFSFAVSRSSKLKTAVVTRSRVACRQGGSGAFLGQGAQKADARKDIRVHPQMTPVGKKTLCT